MFLPLWLGANVLKISRRKKNEKPSLKVKSFIIFSWSSSFPFFRSTLPICFVFTGSFRSSLSLWFQKIVFGETVGNHLGIIWIGIYFLLFYCLVTWDFTKYEFLHKRCSGNLHCLEFSSRIFWKFQRQVICRIAMHAYFWKFEKRRNAYV